MGTIDFEKEKNKRLAEQIEGTNPKKIPDMVRTELIAKNISAAAQGYTQTNSIMIEGKSLEVPFKKKFYKMLTAEGHYELLSANKDDTVKITTQEDLVGEIIKYALECQGVGYDGMWTNYPDAKKIASYWSASAPLIHKKDIERVSWKNEHGINWSKVPWNKIEQGDAEAYNKATRECPAFEKLLSKFSQPTVLMDFIGSMFFEKADRQQYAWIYGPGGTGKGALTRFLAKALGPAYSSEQPPKDSDKFWTRTLIGKRLVCLPECENTGFVRDGLFKSITGGDLVRIEQKNGPTYTMELEAKFMITSNSLPDIGDSVHDKRRLMLFETKGDPEYSPGFEDELWSQGGAFLNVCMENYRQKYPQHGPLQHDHTIVDELAQANMSHYELILERYFRTPGIDPSKFDAEQEYVTYGEIREILRDHNSSTPRKPEMDRFTKWLKEAHGIVYKRVRLGDGDSYRPPRYLGIAPNKSSMRLVEREEM